MISRARPLLVAATLLSTVSPVGAAVVERPGVFALQGGTARVAMHLTVERGASPLDARLDVWATGPGSNAAITRYEVEHTKKIHLIVVSDDLGTFMHVHPALTGGHFIETLRVPRAALYHVFADVTPTGDGQQVFRFDVPFGSAGRTPVTPMLPERNATAGPYNVTIDPLTLRTKGATLLTARVSKNGRLAGDLSPYLGAAAHAVFIHYADWTYLHVHPMARGAAEAATTNEMPGMTGMNARSAAKPAGAAVDPTMFLHVNATERGAYRCWLEFRGGGTVYDAAFSLIAR